MKTQVHTFKLTSLLLLVVFLISSCSVNQSLLESGQYDALIVKEIKKLRGKRNKKEKDIKFLEEAYARAIKKDLKKIERLKTENNKENWPTILGIYHKIDRRQESVAPLLPLVSKDGYYAQIEFYDIDAMIVEARLETASFLYNEGLIALGQSVGGKKLAAREAYHLFNDAQDLNPDLEDIRSLISEAKYKGTQRILFMVDEQDSYSPYHMDVNEFIEIPVHDLNSKWQRFHKNPATAKDIDMTVVFKMVDFELSPAYERERNYFEEKVISKGFVSLKDLNGRPLTDTLGNVKQKEIFETVTADVLEVTQERKATIIGVLHYYDHHNGELLRKRTVTSASNFNNQFVRVRGDNRALSSETKRKLNGDYIPFPQDYVMLMRAGQALTPAVRKNLQSCEI